LFPARKIISEHIKTYALLWTSLTIQSVFVTWKVGVVEARLSQLTLRHVVAESLAAVV
jgi:hypothetical protein